MSEIAEWLESEDFYELMQAYRNAQRLTPQLVSQAFEAVKAAILKAFETEP